MKYIVGIDIGGTKSAVSIGTYSDGGICILDRRAFVTADFKTPYEMLDAFEAYICRISETRNLSFDSIGISCGGPLDTRKGIILSPPNLIGWENVNIVAHFEARLGIKAYLQNDANACANAEWRLGAGRGFRNIVFLTFGTGIGAGLILDGKIYRGVRDMAGEIGHIRLSDFGPVGYGKMGSFEGFCSGGGIAQLARMKALEKRQVGVRHPFEEEDANVTAKTVFEMAEAGDDLCIGICDIVGTYLGKGLSILIDVLNPEAVIIGSIFTRSRNMLWPAARKVIEHECLKINRESCRILTSELGEEIGDMAALITAINDI